MWPDFGEAGGDDDDVAHAAAAALLDDLRDGLRAGGDDRHLDAGADFLDRLVGLLALNGLVLGVDRRRGGPCSPSRGCS